MITAIHYILHFGAPLVVAYGFYKKRWLRVYLIFIATMLIDLDYLLATPIYEKCRYGIGFHPLHSYIAIGLYAVLIIPRKTRVLGIGLMLHIVADSADCLLMKLNC
jgi:hypothetical protein